MEIRIRAALRNRRVSMDADAAEKDADAFEVDERGGPVCAVDGHTPLRIRKQSASGDHVTLAERGTVVKVPVGPVLGRKMPRSFFFEHRRDVTRVFTVSLERPLGVVLEETRAGRIVVVGFADQSRAWRGSAVARLGPDSAGTSGDALAIGDVVRGFTTTTFEYPSASLIGLKGPSRVIVLFGMSPRQRWPAVRTALRRGDVADGQVTLVIERAIQSAAS